MKFLKNFGLGILWAVLFPLICVAIALIAVAGVFVFIVEFVIMIIHFFQGKKLFPMFSEDEKALAIRQAAMTQRQAPATPNAPTQQIANNSTTIIQQNYYGAHNPYGVPPYGQPPYGQNPYGSQTPTPPYVSPSQPQPAPALPPQAPAKEIEVTKEAPKLLNFPSSDETKEEKES